MLSRLHQVILKFHRRVYIGTFDDGNEEVANVTRLLKDFGVPAKVVEELEDYAEDDVIKGLILAAHRKADRLMVEHRAFPPSFR